MTRPSFSTTIKGISECTQNGVLLPGSIADNVFELASETISGTHRRMPEGFMAATPYSLRRVKSNYGYGIVETKTSTTDTIYRGCVGGGGSRSAFNATNAFNNTYLWSDSPASYHQDRALIKARLAMKQQNVNLGVAFAERSQTARLVGDTALSLVRSVTALRHGQWRSAFRALGLTSPKRAPRGSNWPQKWLEMQYGWKPLVSDVYGAVSALANRDASDWRITGKGSSKDKLHASRDGQLVSGMPSSLGHGEFDGWEGCFVRIDAIPSNGFLHDLTALGITNPLEIAWEVIPYSFVVDWFLPVGNYLSSLDAMLGYGPTSCSISLMKRGKWKLTGVTGMANSSVEVKTAAWEATSERVSLTRTVSSSVPLPSRPRFKDPRSFAHMANALSLLAGAFGRR